MPPTKKAGLVDTSRPALAGLLRVREIRPRRMRAHAQAKVASVNHRQSMGPRGRRCSHRNRSGIGWYGNQIATHADIPSAPKGMGASTLVAGTSA